MNHESLDRIRIVRLEDPSEFRKAESVQRDAWGIDEEESVVPFHVLIAAQRHSGLVLGAYDGRRMVGCTFGISAYDRKRRRPYHYSHITGVLREYQEKGVGSMLKRSQRDILLRQNVDLVEWTFDPLQAGNAYFNLRKLGAIAKEYHRDLYGKMPDMLNRGMISDRFEVEWWIGSHHVKKTLEGKRMHLELSHVLDEEDSIINKTGTHGRVRIPGRSRLGLNSQKLLFEIPYSIREVKGSSLALARKWTLETRRAFEHYFARGYTVTDILVGKWKGENRIYYLLERRGGIPGIKHRTVLD